ncbi:MAG TPA: ATP synthase F1 subunit epsilon [Acidobacteriaceae bacterium]|nr:ATP synthase F1 subunit epsilon [Acidobacteriaceae bacterium]
MADKNQLRVRLVTPDRILVDQTADSVEVPSSSGYLEVLYGHAPLLAELAPGEVRLHAGVRHESHRFSVARGFVEVLPERVTILAESAMKPEEIDLAAAQKELDHGHKLWSEAGDDAEKYAHANEIIREAESRLESNKEH